MNKEKLTKIFEIFNINNPYPITELIYSNVFELLIAVILSAQATDKSVNKVTQALYKVARTPEQIYDLGELKFIEYIKSIGLYNTKAKNIIRACKILIEKFNSVVPDNITDLVSLPGVGRKTANVVLNAAFGQSTIAVDTHVFRLANRIPLVKEKSVVKIENKLLRLIPKEYLKNAHQWLVLHGRYVCKAKNPKCNNCIIFNYCEYKNKEKYLQYAY